MEMGRLVNRSVDVRTSHRGTPEAVLLDDRWVEVAGIEERWRDTGCWWSGEREKVFYRLRIARGGLLEIYRETRCPGSWVLYRIYD